MGRTSMILGGIRRLSPKTVAGLADGSVDPETSTILNSALYFLQHPTTDAVSKEQYMHFTREQIVKLLRDIDRMSNQMMSTIDIHRFAERNSSGGYKMSLGKLLELFDEVEKANSLARAVVEELAPRIDNMNWAMLAHEDDIISANFSKIDIDNNLGLDLKELIASLKFYGATEADAIELFARFDYNKDGLIQHDEYERMIAVLLAHTNASTAVVKWSKALSDFPQMQLRSREWLDRVVGEQLGATPMQQEKPTIVIPYGAPGSGKSSATQAALKALGILKEDCVEPNIDDLVRSYMHDVMHNEEMFADQETYHAARSLWPARSTVAMMQSALATRRHIVVETTGRNTWLAKEIIRPASKQGYHTVIVYVLAPLAKIAPRALARKITTGQGHPPFAELGQTAIKAARNLHLFVDAGGTNTTVLFANNAGASGAMSVLRADKDGPALADLAMSEPFQLEVSAMLLQHSRGKAYTKKALKADGFVAMPPDAVDRVGCLPKRKKKI